MGFICLCFIIVGVINTKRFSITNSLLNTGIPILLEIIIQFSTITDFNTLISIKVVHELRSYIVFIIRPPNSNFNLSVYFALSYNSFFRRKESFNFFYIRISFFFRVKYFRF